MFSKRGQSVNFEKIDLPAGLYLVATPIGNARDITLRALDILASADVLAAEDTRTLRRLMQIHGLSVGDRQVLAYHDHNGAAVRPKLLRMITDGQSVAYASDAGTPLVADPGYQLARAAIEEGLNVTSAPGASAVLGALSIAGLPSDRFMFVGFPPSGQSAKAKWMSEALMVQASVVFFESAKRVHGTLRTMCESGFGDRQVAVCREITKRFEEVRRGSANEVLDQLDTGTFKGEVVVVVDRGSKGQVSDAELHDALRKALTTMRVKDAATLVAGDLGMPRRLVYQAALEIEKEE